MKSNGETMNSSTVVSKILISLTTKFNYVVCAIEESNDLSTLSLDELHGSLLVHEQWMQHAQPEEQVLKVTHDDRSSPIVVVARNVKNIRTCGQRRSLIGARRGPQIFFDFFKIIYPFF